MLSCGLEAEMARGKLQKPWEKERKKGLKGAGKGKVEGKHLNSLNKWILSDLGLMLHELELGNGNYHLQGEFLGNLTRTEVKQRKSQRLHSSSPSPAGSTRYGFVLC